MKTTNYVEITAEKAVELIRAMKFAHSYTLSGGTNFGQELTPRIAITGNEERSDIQFFNFRGGIARYGLEWWVDNAKTIEVDLNDGAVKFTSKVLDRDDEGRGTLFVN